MAGIITPAMYEISMGMDAQIPEWAHRYADRVLLDQGIDPLKAFDYANDPEPRRLHYVEARDFMRRIIAESAGSMGGIALDLVTGQSLTSTTGVLRDEGIV